MSITQRYGVVHVVQGPFSNEHWDVAPGSGCVQAKSLVADGVGSLGLVVMVSAAGATVSTTQARVVVALSVPSTTALTAKV